MNANPLVSVVIPCYNHENFVQDCIQSVIDQTYQNIELIIIDDGSKDHSIEKIKEMLIKCQNRFIRFEFKYRSNKGLSTTLNEALKWCQGKYFSVIASDDMMLMDKIQHQVDYLIYCDDKNIVGVFGGYHLIDNQDQIIKTMVKQKVQYGFDEIFLHNFNLPAPTALLKIDCVKAVGGYVENLKIEDWYMWLKLTENGGKLMYLDKVFVNYRYHDSNISKNLIVMNEERRKVIDNFVHCEQYPLAELKIQWLKATDYMYINKTHSFKLCFLILQLDPKQIFSLDMIRFGFHMIRSILKL